MRVVRLELGTSRRGDGAAGDLGHRDGPHTTSPSHSPLADCRRRSASTAWPGRSRRPRRRRPPGPHKARRPKLRHPAGRPAPGSILGHALAVGQAQGVPETQLHADGGQGMVVADGIAHQEPIAAAIDPAGTDAVGSALKGPGSEYTAKRRAKGPRQHIGVTIPQKGRTFAARGRRGPRPGSGARDGGRCDSKGPDRARPVTHAHSPRTGARRRGARGPPSGN